MLIRAISRNYTKLQFGITNSKPHVQSKLLNCQINSLQSIQTFRSSRPLYIHPVVAFIIRPLGRALMVIFGRTIKIWWRKLPKDKKTVFYNHFHKYKILYAGTGIMTSGACTLLYQKQFVICSFSERKRFMLFNEKDLNKVDDIAFQEELKKLKGKLLHNRTPELARVLRVGSRLTSSRPELANRKWKIAVVDSPDVVNAHCYSTGQIVLFSGLLYACANDDQLAAVLAHEMAHVLLQHTNLKKSKELLTEWMLWPLFFITWAIVPSDLTSLLLSWFYDRATNLSVTLPYSRDIELEADFYGLILMTFACYDEREASKLWQTLYINEMRKQGLVENKALRDTVNTVAEWLSTHPSPLMRYRFIELFVPFAPHLRERVARCPPLSQKNSRGFSEMSENYGWWAIPRAFHRFKCYFSTSGCGNNQDGCIKSDSDGTMDVKTTAHKTASVLINS